MLPPFRLELFAVMSLLSSNLGKVCDMYHIPDSVEVNPIGYEHSNNDNDEIDCSIGDVGELFVSKSMLKLMILFLDEAFS
jgi:hypothetical protein